ncbi:hypothetical protein CDA63_18725 [Hymenobacter amundsenii]|uniref:Uncharacterized protein n=1 Tax=Hymenobacter amundsenii TaxID=2006685 RepID=A0A246FGC3_9BACT|nr:hypothetical protein [Hymenobacter amundsenii]OWP61579.1 hypothetical protein CDA63_18725 [Hymenobacter amundsenii]
MSRKDYVAYAVFSMVAMCCFFAGKEALGFFGSVFGGTLGMFAGMAAMRLVARRSPRFGVYALGLVTVVGLSALYGLVRLSDRAVTVANLKGRWVASDHGRPVSLEIGDSTAVLDLAMLLKPLRFGVVLKQDSLLMTSPTNIKLAWRVYTLTKTRMNVGADSKDEENDIVLDFQREDE